MIDADRYKLLHGPYRTPKYRIGRRVRFAVRGEMKVKEFSDAPIPWPMGRLRGGPCFLIVCGGLLKAIRRESEQAICHHWGVCRSTVWTWRKALNVPQTNKGTHRLYVDYTPEQLTPAAQCRAVEQGNTPDANAKKAGAARRRTPSAKTLRVLAEGRKKLNTPEVRRKISEAHKRRGTIPPAAASRLWTAEEDALILLIPNADAARQTRRTVLTVESRRVVLRRRGLLT